MKCERDQIRNRIHSINPKKWKADPYDVRYFLISELKKVFKKSVLDVGGGIGIVCSEMDNSNFRVVLDIAFDDLKTCNSKTDPSIHTVCGSFTNLPFREDFFDVITSSHLIELTKKIDVINKQKMNEKFEGYPTVNRYLSEIYRVLKNGGNVFLTTPNNAYFKDYKLYYNELKIEFSQVFKNYKILFYNTYPKFTKNRKLDLGNVLPKFKSKFVNPDKIINDLMKKNSKNNFSKYFYCVLKKI